MSDKGDSVDFDLGDAVVDSGDDDSGSSNSGGPGNRGKRTAVYAKLDYGTEAFPPKTDCAHCDRRAEGVIIGVLPDSMDNGSMKGTHCVCPDHREELENTNRFRLDNYTYKTFVDDDE